MKFNVTLRCILFAIAANLYATVKAQAVDVTDSLALVDFYNSTDGPQWKNHDNWLTTKPVSTWYGVNLTDNRVTSLFLTSNKLSGVIPASIGNLTQLTGLYLYNNQLNGAIPASIGNLVNLTTLAVSDNKLSGTIPASVGNLIYLRYLELYNNKLTGSIPVEIGNLVNLWGLYLDNNKLTGDIPASIGNLVNLKELYLYNNQLSSAIPVTIGNLVFLVALNLNNNQLSDSIPSAIGNLVHLNYLYLSNNQFSGVIPEMLGNLKKLNSLLLNNNQLSGAIPASFRKLKELSYLDLSYNHLSQNGSLYFPSGKRYVNGSISNNLFTFDGLQFIAKKFPQIIYAPQGNITIHQQGNVLSVYAGGTPGKNTYKWHKAGEPGRTAIKGDSTFSPTESGMYYVTVTNSVAVQLTLYSDTINFTLSSTKQGSSSIIAKTVIPATTIKHMQVFPNPAKDIVHIQTNGTAIIAVINNAGKILLTKTINNSGEINVSAFANGIYYIQNKITGEAEKVIVVH